MAVFKRDAQIHLLLCVEVSHPFSGFAQDGIAEEEGGWPRSRGEVEGGLAFRGKLPAEELEEEGIHLRPVFSELPLDLPEALLRFAHMLNYNPFEFKSSQRRRIPHSFAPMQPK